MLGWRGKALGAASAMVVTAALVSVKAVERSDCSMVGVVWLTGCRLGCREIMLV